MASKISSTLLDNLWLWGTIAISIMFAYGVWVLIEVINMHGMPVSPFPP